MSSCYGVRYDRKNKTPLCALFHKMQIHSSKLVQIYQRPYSHALCASKKALKSSLALRKRGVMQEPGEAA